MLCNSNKGRVPHLRNRVTVVHRLCHITSTETTTPQPQTTRTDPGPHQQLCHRSRTRIRCMPTSCSRMICGVRSRHRVHAGRSRMSCRRMRSITPKLRVRRRRLYSLGMGGMLRDCLACDLRGLYIEIVFHDESSYVSRGNFSRNDHYVSLETLSRDIYLISQV